MISFEQVTKRYPGGHVALADATLTVASGEMLVLIGHSGAGKTTVLKLMAAIERPSSGTLMMNGQNVGALRRGSVPFFRRHFGLVFQDHKLLYDRSVLDNAMLPLDIQGLARGESLRRARAALDRVGLLARQNSLPVTMSGGEQQRLCIARAIVHNPRVLLADEPTANLDPAYAMEIAELLRTFNSSGVTCVVATHDPEVTARLQGRVLSLQEGRVST
ncbi:MAG: cell division ATP-binding protein FtsE [Burkholderiales bacterium]